MGLESLHQILHPFDKSDLQVPHPQDLASIELSLKDSPPPSPLLPQPSILSSSSSSEELSSDDSPRPSPSEALEQVDSFLKDALNSRNRITVLRLDHEIEKFVRNSKLQQLLLKPMPSSYERLAAHRVAQHYGLQSMVVDSNSPTGSRVLLLKTPESRLPVVKLVDIPVDPASQEKPGPPCPLLEKVAIKQRSNASSQSDGCRNNADSGRLTPVKSVEERKEEYDKARARIFNNGESPNTDENEDSTHDVVAEVASVKLQELIICSQATSNGEQKEKSEADYPLRCVNKVAIFRDREKDMKDPDYDRNYDRYSQRMNTGYGIKGRPLVMHGVYHPSVNLNDLSRLHAVGLQHMCPDPAAYSMSRGPWPMLAAGPANALYPNAFYGNVSNHHTGLRSPHVSFPSQRFPHTGHYLDRCQNPQPGFHCKTSSD